MAAQGSPAPGMAPSRPYDGSHGAGDALHHSAQRPKSRVVEGPSEGEVRETNDAPQ